MNLFRVYNGVSRRRFLGLTSIVTLKTLVPGRRGTADQAKRAFKIQVTADGGPADPYRLEQALDELTRGLVMEQRHLYATCHIYSRGDVSVRVQDARSGRISEGRMPHPFGFETEDVHRLYAYTLQLAVRLAPDEPYLIRALGDYYLAFRRHDDGIACFEALMEAHPQASLLPFQLGLQYERAGRKEEAQRAFQRAYALDPDDPVTAYNLGVMAADLGQFREAERWFREALNRDPGLLDARVRLDWLKNRTRTDAPRIVLQQ